MFKDIKDSVLKKAKENNFTKSDIIKELFANEDLKHRYPNEIRSTFILIYMI